MFSPSIQSYINSSGEASAMTRAKHLDAYINTLWNKTPDVENAAEEEIQPFNRVLKSSLEENPSNGVFKLDEPPKIPFGTLSVGAKLSSGTNTKSEIMKMIDDVCNKYDVDSKLVQAVVEQESGFNPNVKSKAGALGLMQLMPKTAEGLGVGDPLNPKENIEGGVKYLKQLLDKFHGNKILALAAYNAGPNAVSKYNGVPPYKETQNYVKSVLSKYL